MAAGVRRRRLTRTFSTLPAERRGMAIVDTNFPSRIGLFHNEDGGPADWNVLVEDFTAEVVVNNRDPINYADQTLIELHVNGVETTVGDLYTDSQAFFLWKQDPQGTFTLSGRRDDDSSRIVAQHDATQYDGLPPGQGEWVVRHIEFNRAEGIVHREPVTVTADWINPNVLALQNCSASATDLKPGDQTTLSATIDNPGFDPLAGDAVAFVGGTETVIPFEVAPRGEASVEATFEVTEGGTMDYGFDLRNVGHNY